MSTLQRRVHPLFFLLLHQQSLLLSAAPRETVYIYRERDSYCARWKMSWKNYMKLYIFCLNCRSENITEYFQFVTQLLTYKLLLTPKNKTWVQFDAFFRIYWQPEIWRDGSLMQRGWWKLKNSTQVNCGITQHHLTFFTIPSHQAHKCNSKPFLRYQLFFFFSLSITCTSSLWTPSRPTA